MCKSLRDYCKLYDLSENQILDAEKRMGIGFPRDLFDFYVEYGYGFVNNTKQAINRLMDPQSCADIRLREDIYEFDSDLEMYETYEDEAMLFFEINEGVYASIGMNK